MNENEVMADTVEDVEIIDTPLSEMTEKQKELMKKHGTPRAFQRACEEGFRDLMITWDEYLAGVSKYVEEWKEAGRA